LPKAEDFRAAELFYDLGGKKKKRLNWIEIAERIRKEKEIRGSMEKVAEHFNKSVSLLNSIARLKDLDSRVQEIVKKGDIGFDSAQRLNVITPASKQFEVAKLLVGLQNKKQRDLIAHAKNLSESDLLDYREKVLGEKVRRERLRILILPMPEQLYQDLERRSKDENKPIEKLVPQIIRHWLYSGDQNK
jgi:hypothetical protein